MAYGLSCIGEEGVLPAALWWYPYWDNEARGPFGGCRCLDTTEIVFVGI